MQRMQKEMGTVNTGPITDIHSHILPYIDDGAKSIDVAVGMAKMALSEGIKRIIATPHFDPETKNIQGFLHKRENGLNELRRKLERNQIDVEIIPGAEVYLVPGIAELDDLELLCIGNTRYMLVEISFIEMPQWLDEILYKIQLRGITPILAHPERSIKISKEPQKLRPLVEKGVLLQLNASSICDTPHRELRKCTRYLIKSGMAHFIATDSHSLKSRPPKIQEALEIVAKDYGSDTVEYMLENARVLGDGGIVKTQPCVEYKPGIWERLFG